MYEWYQRHEHVERGRKKEKSENISTRLVEALQLRPLCVICCKIHAFPLPPLPGEFSSTGRILQRLLNVAHPILHRQSAFIPPLQYLRPIIPGCASQRILVEYELQAAAEPPFQNFHPPMAARVLHRMSVVLGLQLGRRPPLQHTDVARGARHVHHPADLERQATHLVLLLPPVQNGDLVPRAGVLEGSLSVIEWEPRVEPPVEGRYLAVAGGTVHGVCDGARFWRSHEIGVALEDVFPPGENGSAAVTGCFDGNEVVGEDGEEERVVLLEEELNDVDVSEAHGYDSADLGWWMC